MALKQAASVAGTGLKIAGKIVLYSILGTLGSLFWLLFMPDGSLKVAVLAAVVFFGGRYLLRSYKAKQAGKEAQ